MSGRITLPVVLTLVGTLLVAHAQPQPGNASPSVSPDGRHVAFISTRTGNPDLYAIGTDGTGERPLTQTPEAESKPQWSRDGRRLLYAVGRGQGSEVRELDASTGSVRQVGSIPSRGLTVARSGALVAYTSGPWQTSRLAIARIDGSAERFLTTPDQTPIAWNPAFSPDEAWVTFTGQDGAGNLQIFVVEVSTGNLHAVTQMTPAQGRAQVPSFAADGERLAFQLNRPGSSDVWVADRDGRSAPAAVVMANGKGLNEAPSWFPDGRTLAIQSNRTGTMEIWVVSTDGAAPRQLTGNTAAPSFVRARMAESPPWRHAPHSDSAR